MEELILLLRFILALLLVAALACLALRYGLRALHPGLNRGRLRVLEKVPLDVKTGSALLLVRVGDELLLLGMARGSVSLIKELDPAAVLPDPGERALDGSRPAAAVPFERILKSAGPGLPLFSKRKGGLQ